MTLAPVIQAQAGAQLRVQWSATDDCPDAADVEARIRARLPSIDPASSVRVEAVVTRTRADAYQVRVRLSGTVTGERELAAESCTAAADATALLVALAIDPARARPEPEPARATTAQSIASDAPVEPATDAGPTRADEPGPEAAGADAAVTNDGLASDATDASDATEGADREVPLVLRLEVGAGVPIDWGTTPGITSGALLLVHLSLDRVLLVASADWLAPREMKIAPGATLSGGWMSVAFDGCYLIGATTQSGPCLGVDLGQLTATSTGLVDAVERSELAVFASGSWIARARLTRALVASVSLGMRTSVWYPRFVVAGVGDAFQPAALGLRATVAFMLVLG